VSWSFLGTVCTAVLKFNMVAMGPSVAAFICLVQLYDKCGSGDARRIPKFGSLECIIANLFEHLGPHRC
jgi:hypothetical protein